MYIQIITAIVILIGYFVIVFDLKFDTTEGFIIHYTVNYKRKCYKLW